MGDVRGATIVGALQYLREHFGAEAVRHVIEALPPHLRTAISDGGPGLLEVGWYDCAALIEIVRVADREYGASDLKLAREMGRAQAFTDTGRFFKWMLRLAGPKTIFMRSTSVWNNYHNSGRYIVEELSDRHATLRIEEWSSASDVMCRRVEGWVERALELTLGAAVRPTIREVVHLQRNPSVSPHLFCRFSAEWGESRKDAATVADKR
jgi:hypothetical protein